MNRRDFIKKTLIAVASGAIPLSSIDFIAEKVHASNTPVASRTTQRIILYFDTHYKLDPERLTAPYDIKTYNETCNKTLIASLSLHPNQAHFIGDIIDYNVAEWDLVKPTINEIKKKFPDIQIYGLMGNHDFLYYKYRSFDNANFPSDLKDEVALKVAAPILPNMSTVSVEGDASLVIANHKMAIISKRVETGFPYNFDIVTAQRINKNTIKFTPPVLHNYSIGDYIRQGWSDTRAIGYFRNAFSNTETHKLTSPSNANYYTRAGNMLFIFISLNHFHPLSQIGWMKMWPDEVEWFKELLEDNYKTCNIIVYTHEPPGADADIGYPPRYNNWSKESVHQFQSICREYHIPLWISGHIHYNWRDASRIYRPTAYGNTTILIGPALLLNNPNEGEFLTIDIEDKSRNLTIKAYSVDSITGELNRAQLQMDGLKLPYPVDFSYKA